MKKKSPKVNYFYNLIFQVFSILTPLITAPYISRVLGSDGVGQYSYTRSIASYFMLFAALGFGYYAQREIAQYQNDKYEQSKIFWEIIIARSISVLVSSLVYIVLVKSGVYGEEYSLLMWILLANVIAVSFDVSFVFQGNEEFGIIVLRSVIIKIIGIALIFVFVKQKSDIWVYVLCQSTSVLLSNISLWPLLLRRLVSVKQSDLRIWRHFKPTLRLFLPTIAISVYTMLDKTLIGLLIDGTNEFGQNYSDIENGNYEQAEKIVKLSLTLLTSLGTVMLPRNSQAIASGNYSVFKSNIRNVLRFVFFLGVPLMFGLAAVAFSFSPWFFGPGYDKVPYLMCIFCPLIIIIGISNVLGLQNLLPLKKDKQFTIAITCGALFNLSLNLILIPLLWSYGACVATVLAEFLVSALMLFFARNDVNILKILIQSWKSIVSGIIMFATTFFTQLFLKASIINTVFLVAEGASVYFTLLFVFRDDFFLNILKTIKKKRKPNI